MPSAGFYRRSHAPGHSPSPSAPGAPARRDEASPPSHYLARVQHGAPNAFHAKPETNPREILLVAPEDKGLSNLAHDAMRYSSDPQTRMGSDFSAGPPILPVDMTFRPAALNNVQVPGDRPSIGRRAVRAFTGFLLTACIGGAGVAWQFYGDAAKQIIASWAPQLVLTSSPPLENPGPPEQPSPPTVQAADANVAPPQPAAPAQTAPEGVAPTAAALSPDSAQLLQPMARDLASVGQEIEQLKASIEQLKASQQQISRDVAKASEQNLRPRMSAPPPRPAAAPGVFDRAQHLQQLSPGTIP
jgi:hypothetical protein